MLLFFSHKFCGSMVGAAAPGAGTQPSFTAPQRKRPAGVHQIAPALHNRRPTVLKHERACFFHAYLQADPANVLPPLVRQSALTALPSRLSCTTTVVVAEVPAEGLRAEGLAAPLQRRAAVQTAASAPRGAPRSRCRQRLPRRPNSTHVPTPPTRKVSGGAGELFPRLELRHTEERPAFLPAAQSYQSATQRRDL